MRNNSQKLGQQIFLEIFNNAMLDKNPGKIRILTKRIPEKP